MTAKPRLGFWQIWNLCFGFMGIQFGFALQNSNVSRIFQTLGASVDDIPVLWVAAPLTGLLVQPIVGHFSDRTWNRLGRRRPYFLAGAILSTLALIAMPNSPTLWVAAGLLWVLDASINISMEPFRAFVGDQLPSEQRPTGYALQSFFIGLGSVIASLLPWLLARCGVANTAAAGAIPDTVKIAFYAGAAALFAAIGWTIVSTREYPPELLTSFDGETPAPAREPRNFVAAIAADLVAMPPTMAKLAIVQFFSWFALFAMWIYTTSAVAEVHFGAKDTQSAAYNEGANWVGVLFAAYNGFAALAAIAIPHMTRRLGLRLTHLVNLALGGAGLVSFLVVRDPDWLLASMVGVGFAWASILSLPYALLSDSLPAAKMGVYMGIFNFFIVIPQVLAAGVLGFLVRTLFGNAPIYALAIGGASLFVAGLCTLIVEEKPHGT